MALFDKPFGQKLKELLDSIVGTKPKFSGILPSDPKYLTSLYPALSYPHAKPSNPYCPGPPNHYGRVTVGHKLARKGHRMKKRRRLEGKYAI